MTLAPNRTSGCSIGAWHHRLSSVPGTNDDRSDKIGAMSVTASAIRTAQRVDRFTYAIRNIVAEAKKVEATGKKVRYLNIGDPNQFGFLTPPHLIEAVIKAMRDGHNGYVPSPGIAEAREAAAADFVSRGVNVSRRSRADHVGHLRRHRARPDRHRRRRRRSAGAVADVSALHRGAREDRRAAGVSTGPITPTTGSRISITSGA